MEAGERDRPLAVRTEHTYDGVEGGQCDGHVRRMRRDARLRCAQDGQGAVIASARGTATARHALIAWLGDILEVDAARALQQIPPGRRQVAQLARGSREQRLGKYGIALANRAISSEVAVAHHGTDADSPIGQQLDAVVGQVCDVDQQLRLCNSQLHVVDEVGSTAEEGSVRVPGEQCDSAGRVARAFVPERIHRAPSLFRSPTKLSLLRSASGDRIGSTSAIAGTMLAYAAQRQRLPLMRSRISSSSRVT